MLFERYEPLRRSDDFTIAEEALAEVALVFYLENVDVGQVLSVSTIAENDILDTVVADDAAMLTVIRKR